MADEQLFIKGDTDGEYTEFTPPTFADSIPEDHRENEIFQDVKDVSGLAVKHVTLAGELAEMKSAQPVIPEQYELPTIPEGIQADEQAMTDFTVLARELGLTQESFNKIVDFDLARAERYNTEAEKAHNKAIADGEATLKTRWGGEYETNRELASSGLRKVLGAFDDGKDIEKELAASGFLNIPSVMRLFRKIGVATSEDVFIKKDQPSSDEVPRGPDGKPRLSYPSMEDT